MNAFASPRHETNRRSLHTKGSTTPSVALYQKQNPSPYLQLRKSAGRNNLIKQIKDAQWSGSTRTTCGEPAINKHTTKPPQAPEKIDADEPQIGSKNDEAKQKASKQHITRWTRKDKHARNTSVERWKHNTGACHFYQPTAPSSGRTTQNEVAVRHVFGHRRQRGAVLEA